MSPHTQRYYDRVRKALGDGSPQAVARWWADLAKRPLRHGTRATYLYAARSVLGTWVSAGQQHAAEGLAWLRRHAHVPPHSPSPLDWSRRPVTADEYRRLLAALKHPNGRLAVEILWTTGLRPATVLALRPEHVVLHEGRLWARTQSKGGRWIQVPLRNDIAARLQALHAWGLTPRSLHQLIRRAALRAVGRPLSPRDFRRAFITDVYRARHDIVLARTLAGHASARTTERYIIPDEAEIVQVVSER